MSSQAFKELAMTFISGKDAKIFSCLSLKCSSDYTENCKCKCSFITKWREWERTLRLNLAKHRAANINRDNVAIPSASEPMDAVTVATKIATEEHSPLEAEHIIDKARWNAIDNLVGLDNFNRNYIYAYFLKILLLERHQVFNIDKGFSEYKSLYAEIIKSADNSVGEST
jgi:hypothetical protein